MSTESTGRNVMVTGRVVYVLGNLFKGQPKVDQNTKQPVKNQAGEQVMEYGFGLAVPKASITEVWNAMHSEALSIYPQGLPPNFAMKYKDGDGPDHNGVPFSKREGYAGCLVLNLSTRLPIKFFRFENGANILINEGIKCGDYVNVQVSIKAHPAQGTWKAGLYMNPNAVQLVGYGTEIVNTPSGDTIFGAAPPPMPVGATAMPTAPQPGQMLVPPTAPAMPPPQAAPHYAVVPPIHQPPPGGQPLGNAGVPASPGAGYPAPGVAATPMAPYQAGPPSAATVPSYPGMPPMPQ